MLRIFTVLLILLAPRLMAQTPRVVVDTPALHSLVSMVMGDTGTPDLLLPRGSDAHEFQLRPSQAKALRQADILFWVGPAQTPWLTRSIDEMKLSDRMETMLRTDSTYLRYYCEGRTLDCVDPHAWLSPGVARLWLRDITARLSKSDPKNAALYMANATNSEVEILRTSQQIAMQFITEGTLPIIVQHDGYDYFAEFFKLTILGAIQIGEATPSAAQIRDIRQLISDQDRVCVFGESGHGMGLVNTVSEGTTAHTGTLDMAGNELEYGPQYYPALLRGIADSITNCAGE